MKFVGLKGFGRTTTEFELTALGEKNKKIGEMNDFLQ